MEKLPENKLPIKGEVLGYLHYKKYFITSNLLVTSNLLLHLNLLDFRTWLPAPFLNFFTLKCNEYGGCQQQENSLMCVTKALVNIWEKASILIFCDIQLRYK